MFYSQSSGSTVFTHHSDQTTRGSPDENSGSVYTTPIHRSSDSIETKSSGMVSKSILELYFGSYQDIS